MTSSRDAAPIAVRPGVGAVLRRLRPRGLFGKYALTIVSIVVFVLAVTGAVETWIIYRETTRSLEHAQRDAVAGIAKRTDTFLADLERQVSWVTRASATTTEDHRGDYELLLQQVPAIADLIYVDGDGHEQLEVSRDTVVSGNDLDMSSDATVKQALSQPVWFGPASFQGRDPFMALTMAHSGTKAGATIARIDLRMLAAVVDAGQLAGANYAYILDPSGRVLATSKGSPVAVGADLGGLPAIKALLADGRLPDTMGEGLRGRSVIRTSAEISITPWAAVVEETTSEALRPITDFLFRLAGLLALGLGLAVLAGLVLARRMIVPIQALHAGATHLAANRFDHRIKVETGDELEELAGQFNRMADDLAGSYARLELKVEERTRDLAQSVRELKALEEIGRALSSSLDLADVLAAIVSRAMALVHADAGAIYSHEAGSATFRLEEAQGFPPALRTAAATVRQAGGTLDAALILGDPISIPDLAAEPRFPARDLTLAAGFRSVLVVGLVGSGRARGALLMYRRQTGEFPARTSGVMQTFAHQSVLAMHNARLFQELINKGEQLEVANAHRTQFFANMSHELRTPLNAVLGYSELLSDGLYGTMPDRAVGVLDRIQTNGKHLLGLINDVLDVTKMEAGALSLSLSDYSMMGLVDGVVAATESLAKTKGLALEAHVPEALPIGRGDERRLTQVLLNLVGNAIKFTDTGRVDITVARVDASFQIAVRDTGPGISPEQQERIFDEFKQVDDANTRKKGGTGLGLAIARRLVAMHGGRIDVASVPDEGATFTVTLPVKVTDQCAAEQSAAEQAVAEQRSVR